MRELRLTHNILLENSESLKMFLREIRKEDTLTEEEELELAAIIRRGGMSGSRAADKMVRANLRFVVSVAKRYQGHGLELAELINEGTIGLMNAVYKFDPYYGYRFVSYAVWWIRQSIQKAVDEQARLVRLPANVCSKIRQVDVFTYMYYAKYERMPSAEEVAIELNISPKDVEEYLALSKCFSDPHDHYSLDDPIDELDERFYHIKKTNIDEDVKLINDYLDANAIGYEKSIDLASLNINIHQCLDRLSSREKKIIMMFYGIGMRERTLEEIGDIIRLSRERVRQIKYDIEKRLRSERYACLLRQHLR